MTLILKLLPIVLMLLSSHSHTSASDLSPKFGTYTFSVLGYLSADFKSDSFNQYDKNGKKTGTWVNEFDELNVARYIIVTNYLDGKRHGLEYHFVAGFDDYSYSLQEVILYMYDSPVIHMPNSDGIPHSVSLIEPNRDYVWPYPESLSESDTLYQKYWYSFSRSGRLEDAYPEISLWRGAIYSMNPDEETWFPSGTFIRYRDNNREILEKGNRRKLRQDADTSQTGQCSQAYHIWNQRFIDQQSEITYNLLNRTDLLATEKGGKLPKDRSDKVKTYRVTSLLSRKFSTELFNQYDNEGRKTGTWIYTGTIENKDKAIVITNYFKGMRNGLEFCYLTGSHNSDFRASFFTLFHEERPILKVTCDGVLITSIELFFSNQGHKATLPISSNHDTIDMKYIYQFSRLGALENEGVADIQYTDKYLSPKGYEKDWSFECRGTCITCINGKIEYLDLRREYLDLRREYLDLRRGFMQGH